MATAAGDDYYFEGDDEYYRGLYGYQPSVPPAPIDEQHPTTSTDDATNTSTLDAHPAVAVAVAVQSTDDATITSTSATHAAGQSTATKACSSTAAPQGNLHAVSATAASEPSSSSASAGAGATRKPVVVNPKRKQ